MKNNVPKLRVNDDERAMIGAILDELARRAKSRDDVLTFSELVRGLLRQEAKRLGVTVHTTNRDGARREGGE